MRPRKCQPNAPSWAKDSLTATNPATPASALDRLFDEYWGASNRHKEEQAKVILTGIAQNQNTPRELLSLLCNGYSEEMLFNPILSLLAMESPEWCKENFSHTFLRLAMPALCEQVQSEVQASQGASNFDDNDNYCLACDNWLGPDESNFCCECDHYASGDDDS